jgi:hypothetical protein
MWNFAVKNIRHIPFLAVSRLVNEISYCLCVYCVLFFLAKAPESQLLSGLFNLYETHMSYKLIKKAGIAHHKTYWGNCTVG